MGYFDPGPQRPEYTARALYEMFLRLQQAINYMDTNNFKNKISGSIITDGTLSPEATGDFFMPMRKLQWREYSIPLILLAQPFTTTSTTEVNLGGYFAWDSSKFPGGDWYLEATLSSADASATATCGIRGSQSFGTIITTNTSLTRVRSDFPLSLPQAAENLWITLKTNNASYTASLVSARLIFVPK